MPERNGPQALPQRARADGQRPAYLPMGPWRPVKDLLAAKATLVFEPVVSEVGYQLEWTASKGPTGTSARASNRDPGSTE
jgi:hypothetical protein